MNTEIHEDVALRALRAYTEVKDELEKKDLEEAEKVLAYFKAALPELTYNPKQRVFEIAFESFVAVKSEQSLGPLCFDTYYLFSGDMRAPHVKNMQTLGQYLNWKL